MMLENILQEIKQLDIQKKLNPKETEMINMGNEEDIKKTRINIHPEERIVRATLMVH